MAKLVSPVLTYVARLAAGVVGTGRVVPADTLRSDALRGSSDAADYPLVNADRTFVLRYQRGAPLGSPIGSPFGSDTQATIRADLIVSYRTDTAYPEIDTDAGADDTSPVRAMAADDMAVILRALTWAENQQASAGNGATVVSITPDGDHQIDERGDVLLSVQPLAIVAQWSPITAWDMG